MRSHFAKPSHCRQYVEMDEGIHMQNVPLACYGRVVELRMVKYCRRTCQTRDEAASSSRPTVSRPQAQTGQDLARSLDLQQRQFTEPEPLMQQARHLMGRVVMFRTANLS